MNNDTEELAVEMPAYKLLGELGWELADWNQEKDGPRADLSGRERLDEVVLTGRLKQTLATLNPDLPAAAIAQAVGIITADRSIMQMTDANKTVYGLLKNGVKVEYEHDGARKTATARLIDWQNAKNNSYLAVRQLTVLGVMHKRRPDMVLFINGLPLINIELKSAKRTAEDAVHENFRDYKDTIPQLYHYIGFCIASNGTVALLGSMPNTPLEFWAEWKRIADEDEPGKRGLETMLRASCAPDRVLDTLENFVLYSAEKRGLTKIVAKNHQLLGVNRVFAEVSAAERKLGVYWHTQGSGKSYSMLFFAQKVLRKQPGNWSFVVVTDRNDLDDQIYKNFARAGVVTEPEHVVRAGTIVELKQKLTENHRFIFTTIQKFQDKDGFPVLTERDDVIVMVDEAHRTQYDIMASNMRTGLPNAKYLGFTGTPLMAGEEKTREVFGDYVSRYDFKRSVEDKATVPLVYEPGKPELQLDNPQFNDEMQAIIDEAELDPDQEKLLERRLGQQYHLITREDRLQEITRHLVEHFANRGYMGKAMVVSIDRFTAVKMFNKVKIHLATLIANTEHNYHQATDPDKKADLRRRLDYLKTTDMAVVISNSQNELDDFKQRGVDITQHRYRMVHEDLEEKFKDPDDPLRIVFVCAMWITGFDAPSVSTIYLDKPLKNHTLMQTIARANRVFGEKTAGSIVDYIGVLTNLKKALAVYASTPKGEVPLQNKKELIPILQSRLAELESLSVNYGHAISEINRLRDFARLDAIAELTSSLLRKIEDADDFVNRSHHASRLCKALLPEPGINELVPLVKLCNVVAAQISQLTDGGSKGKSADDVMSEINDLLDRSIVSKGFVINENPSDPIDLSRLNLASIENIFKNKRELAAFQALKTLTNSRLDRMLEENPTRIDFKDKIQKLIDEYNNGSKNVIEAYEELLRLVEELDEEKQRANREGLTEEYLAVYDILVSKPAPSLTKKEQVQVKKIAQDLLDELKQSALVLDWKKAAAKRARVQVVIRSNLRSEQLPLEFTDELEREKERQLFEHFYERYEDARTNIYSGVSV